MRYDFTDTPGFSFAWSACSSGASLERRATMERVDVFFVQPLPSPQFGAFCCPAVLSNNFALTYTR